MKLQPASRKELLRIAAGTAVCDVILLAALFVLSLFGIGSFTPVRILLSMLAGSVIAVSNFAIMCLTVQSAVGMEDKKKMKAKFQFSYNARMMIQAGWTVAAFLIPNLHFVAAAAPILFPKVTILFLQATGRLMPKNETTSTPEQAKE